MTGPGEFPGALIDRLAEDLRPVRVRSPRFLAGQYAATLACLGCIFLVCLGSADAAWVRTSRLDFVPSLVTLIFSIAVGPVLLVRYSRPGMVLSRRSQALFLSALGLALLIELVRFAAGRGGAVWGPGLDQGWRCATAALVMGAITATVLALEIRREAPVRLAGAGLFLVLSAGALSALVLQLHCANDNPVHQLLWHLALPLAILVLGARAISHRALRW